jgi:hypothetical protein
MTCTGSTSLLIVVKPAEGQFTAWASFSTHAEQWNATGASAQYCSFLCAYRSGNLGMECLSPARSQNSSVTHSCLVASLSNRRLARSWALKASAGGVAWLPVAVAVSGAAVAGGGCSSPSSSWFWAMYSMTAISKHARVVPRAFWVCAQGAVL